MIRNIIIGIHTHLDGLDLHKGIAFRMGYFFCFLDQRPADTASVAVLHDTHDCEFNRSIAGLLKAQEAVVFAVFLVSDKDPVFAVIDISFAGFFNLEPIGQSF